jgi:dihydrolipoamide dehydrogenase
MEWKAASIWHWINLRVGDTRVRADAMVIAAGARSNIPEAWQRGFADGILTVDNLFERESLPESVAVIGLGPIGTEMSQVLHRLGVEVTGFGRSETLSGIEDPVVNRAAVDVLGQEVPLLLGQAPQVERRDSGFAVRSGDREVLIEKLFLAMGRSANLERPSTWHICCLGPLRSA